MMKKMMDCRCSETWHDLAKLFLRVVVGAVFFMHGYQKLTVWTVEKVAGMFTQMHWIMPEVLAYLVTYGELVAGIGLILGVCTHWAGKLGSFIALVAFLGVHVGNGFFLQNASGAMGYEYILLILASSVMVMVHGAGKFSVDKMWLKRD